MQGALSPRRVCSLGTGSDSLRHRWTRGNGHALRAAVDQLTKATQSQWLSVPFMVLAVHVFHICTAAARPSAIAHHHQIPAACLGSLKLVRREAHGHEGIPGRLLAACLP